MPRSVMDASPLGELLILPATDRADLAIALWDSLTDDERGRAFELTDEHRAELARRWAERVQNPGAVVPWAVVRSKLFD